MKNKICTKCKESKPLSRFSRWLDGQSPWYKRVVRKLTKLTKRWRKAAVICYKMMKTIPK